jgi:hypothetical protein
MGEKEAVMHEPVIAARQELHATQHLVAPPEDVFPLLCPVREGEWLEGWECTLLHSESGVAERDCVFATDDPETGARDLWLISRHRPPREIEFIRFDGRRIIRYTIGLEADGEGGSVARWRQVVTAVDDGPLDQDAQETFAAMVAVDEQALNHFLETGKMSRRE